MSYSGGTFDLDRINTSTRRANSGESFSEACVELWAGVWAWQPTGASARENVRARMDARSGFTTVNTVIGLSHAEPISPPSGGLFEVTRPPLKQAHRAPQVPRRTNIHQRDAELFFKLISHRAQLVLADLHAEPATVPVVRGLHRPILHQGVARNARRSATRSRTRIQIESHVGRDSQPRLGW